MFEPKYHVHRKQLGMVLWINLYILRTMSIGTDSLETNLGRIKTWVTVGKM